MGIIEKIGSLFKKDERRYGLFSISFEQFGIHIIRLHNLV